MPDIYFGTLEQGDILLLASDGLTGMLEDEQLVRILSSDGGPQHWVDRMITEANRRGRAGQHHGDRGPDRLGGQQHRRDASRTSCRQRGEVGPTDSGRAVTH